MSTSRLRHSERGYFRSLQLSKKQLFMFVEGSLDRPFIERILDKHLDESLFSIRAAKELPGGSGGKERLLDLHQDLLSKNLLFSENLGKKMAVLILMDKDVDDLLGVTLGCQHVIYTPSYDIEGHLLSCGRVTHALADAAGITRAQASAIIPDFLHWSKEIAKHWADWITLCLISHSHSINCGYSFKRPSSINPDPFSPPCAAKLQEAKQTLQRALALSEEVFNAEYKQRHDQIREIIETKNPFLVFKGKWLESLLEIHCKKHHIADANWNSLGPRVLSNILGQLDIPELCSCHDPFTTPIQQIAQRLN